MSLAALQQINQLIIATTIAEALLILFGIIIIVAILFGTRDD